MPVTHGGLVMAGAGGRCAGQGGAGAALCTGLLGAIGSPVIDRGGQQLRQSHWQTLCPFGFLLVEHRETCGFILAKKQPYIMAYVIDKVVFCQCPASAH